MNEELLYKVSTDAIGNPLDGGKDYRFHLPAGIPGSKFWSILLYDTQDQFIIKTDQPWPSVHSQRARLIVNEDGSVDAYFGPDALPGKENNWVKTIPGRSWFLILRFYGLQENPLNISWKPGEIVIMEKIIL